MYPVSSLKGIFPGNPGSVLMIDCELAILERTSTRNRRQYINGIVPMELLQQMKLISLRSWWWPCWEWLEMMVCCRENAIFAWVEEHT